MRYGENALKVIEGVKQKLAELKSGLPPDVQIVPVYDRARLIHRAINTLEDKLIEESLIVALVCLLFCFISEVASSRYLHCRPRYLWHS